MIAAVLILVFVFYLYFDLHKPEGDDLSEEGRGPSHQSGTGVSQASHSDEWEELSTRLQVLKSKLTSIVEQSSRGSAKP